MRFSPEQHSQLRIQMTKLTAGTDGGAFSSALSSHDNSTDNVNLS